MGRDGVLTGGAWSAVEGSEREQIQDATEDVLALRIDYRVGPVTWTDVVSATQGVVGQRETRATYAAVRDSIYRATR